MVGGVVAAAGAAALALALSNPAPPVQLASQVPPREIPTDWASPGEPAAPVAQPDGDPPGLPVPYETAGQLVLVADGKPFGEEAYELHVTSDGALLTSSGRFWFKVVLATVRVTFEQTLEAGGDLRPTRYAAAFHAPLGLDRSVRATIAGGHAAVERSGKTEEIEVDAERAFALGTLSTYALIPRVFALREANGSASFDALVFGGPPSQESSAAADELPTVSVTLAGRARLRAETGSVDADRYHLAGPFGESDLYARGGEFLALHAAGEEGDLLVYRSDFFPSGVEIDPAPSP